MQQNNPPPGGLEPPTFRLTAERANQLRHGGHAILRITCGQILRYFLYSDVHFF